MIQNNHQELLATLGKELGLELSFDEDGICELFADESTLSIKSSEDDGTIILSSVLAQDLPDPINYSAVTDLLALALDPCGFGGGNSPVVGRTEEGLVVAYQVATASVLSTTPLSEILSEFLKTCAAVKALLAEPVSDKAEPSFPGHALSV